MSEEMKTIVKIGNGKSLTELLGYLHALNDKYGKIELYKII